MWHCTCTVTNTVMLCHAGQIGEHPVGIPNNLMPYVQQVGALYPTVCDLSCIAACHQNMWCSSQGLLISYLEILPAAQIIGDCLARVCTLSAKATHIIQSSLVNRQKCMDLSLYARILFACHCLIRWRWASGNS